MASLVRSGGDDLDPTYPGDMALPGFQGSPDMPQGSIVINACAEVNISERESRYRTRRGVIAKGTAGNANMNEIAHGDLVFTVPDRVAGCVDRSSDIPNVDVFAAFNGLPADLAYRSVFIGVAEARNRHDDWESNLQSPVLAIATGGVRTVLNNGRFTIEPGQVVLGLPPTSGNEQKRQSGNTDAYEWAVTTSVRNGRFTAVVTPMRDSAYGLYIGPRHDVLNRVIFKAMNVAKKADEGLIDVATVLHNASLSDASATDAPYLGLRVLFLVLQHKYAEKADDVEEKVGAQEAQGQPDDAGVTVAIKRLVDDLFDDQAVPVFQHFMLRHFGKYSRDDAIDLCTEVATDAGIKQPRSAVTLILTHLAFEHANFCAAFFRSKTLGIALEQSLPGQNLKLLIRSAAV